MPAAETLITRVTDFLSGAKPAVDLRAALKTNPKAPAWKKRDADSLLGMVWHQELGWGSVEAVAEYHTGKTSHLRPGGTRSIAYTFAVRRNGQIVLCNDLDLAVWSHGYKDREGDENAEFMSVLFEGMFHGDGVTDPTAGEPNAAQILSGLALWSVCKEEWGWNDDCLYGHFLFGKPACPGNTLKAVIQGVRANATVKKKDLKFDTVKARQEALKALGYYKGAVDGQWGPASKGALTVFQAKAGLPADGIWGPLTEIAMRDALA